MSSTQRFASAAALFLLVQFALLALFAARPLDQGLFLGASIDKDANLLAPSKKPRLLIIGGSNAAFGFNSELLDRELPYRPINLGLHAGLGVDYFLAQASSGLRSGDLVLLTMELHHFGEMAAQSELLELLEVNPQSATHLSAGHLPGMLDTACEYLGRRLKVALKGGKGRLPYRREAFNEYGDVVAHLAMKRPPFHKLYDRIPGLTERSVKKTADKIARFAASAQDLGASVVFQYPPIPRQAVEAWGDELELIRAALDERTITVLNEPPGYPFSHFFDTTYHLNEAGLTRRTNNTISQLRRVPPP